jgi:MoxR-like ATPase
MDKIDKLKLILQHLKETFVGKNEIIDLLGIGLLARENAFLLGPPGTAKSAIVRAFSNCIFDGKNFEYLLTRFTEPNEIFGPFDIRKLKDGEMITNIEGMMPEASMVFLDEIFNANSAILNSLLMSLNEKVFRRGKETIILPVLMFVGASNQLPEDEALSALLDRFLIRINCDYVDPDLLDQVLIAGRKLEVNQVIEIPTISALEIKELQQLCKKIDLSTIQKPYVNAVHALRNVGVKVSDRRAVKLQNLIASSAMMCGRTAAILSDLWVLKYIWDTEEQIETIEAIVNQIIESDSASQIHPQAMKNKVPDAEELMKEIMQLKEKWKVESLTFEEQNVIKDKLRFLQNRCDWISNPEQKSYLSKEIESFWETILKSF